MSEAAVFRHLAARNVPFAIIAARAMGIRGVLRFSDDTLRNAIDDAAMRRLNYEVDGRQRDVADAVRGVK